MNGPVRPAAPEHTGTPGSGIPRWVPPVGAIAVLGALFWVAGITAGGEAEVTTTFDPGALAASTTLPTITTEQGGQDAPHRRSAIAEVVVPADIGGNLAIEGLSGRLATVSGQSPGPLTLNLTPVGSTVGGYERVELPPFGRDFGLDAAGAWLGFIGGETPAASDLWLVPLDGGETHVLPEITSFRWNRDRPSSLGWFNPTEGSAAEYQRAHIDAAGSLAHFEASAVETNARLVALAATGMWRSFSFGSEGFVAFTHPTLGEVLSRPADIVAVSPVADTALIASLALDDWAFGWTLLSGDTSTPLPWAPPDAFAAAWIDHDTVAFAGLDGAATAWVEVWDVKGESRDAFRIQYRVWDIEVSPDGRFLVMPGVDAAGTHTALLYDLTTRRLTAVIMDDWVQFAGLVPPPPEPGLTPGPAASTN